jgi:hypothetical protein
MSTITRVVEQRESKADNADQRGEMVAVEERRGKEGERFWP